MVDLRRHDARLNSKYFGLAVPEPIVQSLDEGESCLLVDCRVHIVETVIVLLTRREIYIWILIIFHIVLNVKITFT